MRAIIYRGITNVVNSKPDFVTSPHTLIKPIK